MTGVGSMQYQAGLASRPWRSAEVAFWTWIKRLASKTGYELRLFPKSKSACELYYLHDFTRPDGSFDYDRYRAVQEAGNRGKLEKLWADEATIAEICAFMAGEAGTAGEAGPTGKDDAGERESTIARGLCHGVRRGVEQQLFAKLCGAEVIGTEIATSASSFPGTVEWDFHEPRKEWEGAFDFVYTNSFDHAYDPEKALATWTGQLKRGGWLFIEHSIEHSQAGASELDPFGAHPHIMPYLIARWGQGRYAVTRILEPAERKFGKYKIWVFVVQAVGQSVGAPASP